MSGVEPSEHCEPSGTTEPSREPGWDRNVTKRKKEPKKFDCDYDFKLFERQRCRLDNEILKRCDLINKMMLESVPSKSVNDELVGLNDAFAELLFVCEKLRPLVSEPKELDSFLAAVDTDIFLTKNSAIRYVKESEAKSSSKSTKSSEKKSSSGRSSSSKTSSTEEKMLENATQLASLEVELAFAEREGMKEKDRLLLEKEIAKKKAILGVFENWTSRNSFVQERVESTRKSAVSSEASKPSSQNLKAESVSSQGSVNFLPTPPSKPRTSSSKSFRRVHSNFDTVTLSNAICDLVKMQGAPTVKLNIFKGDPLEYRSFITNFEELVEKRISDSEGRLARLMNFTEGEANELIQCCLYMSDGYDYAKSLLKKKYGDPHKIMISFKKQLDKWEVLKAGDSSAFGKFYSFLLKCGSVIEGKLWNSFDTADNLCIITSKLPIHCRDKWNRKVINIRTQSNREPCFKDVLLFVENEMIVASDPLFSREAYKDRFSDDSRGGHGGFKPRRFHDRKDNQKGFKTFLCSACDVDHDLEVCPIFKKKNMEEKYRFLLKENICFGCLEKGHLASSCKNRRTCLVCNKKHPTTIHGMNFRRPPRTSKDPKKDSTDLSDKPDSKPPKKPEVSNPPVTCGLNKDSERNISMCVVPIILRHELSKSDIVTFAVLDNCSQASFISEEILSMLSIPSETTDLTVDTITSSKTEVCHVVSGLKVKGLHSGDGSWVSLPKLFSKSYIPVDQSEVPTAKSIQAWPYLKSIESELPNTASLKIGILVGGNCPRAIEPLKTIASQDDGPFAYKTKLGWCVVGPICSPRSKSVSCCRISVNSNGRSNHLLVEEPRIKDSGIETMLKNLHSIDSVPETRMSDFEVFSQDDLHFLEIVESSEFIDGHYHVPLPFRNENIIFPNNLPLAQKRLSLLKKKFESSSKFHSDYVGFVNKIIDKGWCQEVSSPYPEGQNWYIPHHGVYHPTKNKIRVVFDCSSSYKGFCINKELMHGPDLANHLIGVLMRFRQEHVAFTADIEAMFYQIKIPEGQRRFHQFLWWRDGDYSKPPATYEMNAHLQGSTSSPSCSNFALKRTASAGESEFGAKAAETLRKNFYVDDLLKSIDLVESAKSLITNVSGLCDSGGFRLTQFSSNYPEVLEAVPVEKRKDEKSSSVQRVLGVLWSLKNDIFQFEAPTKVFSKTRRGMLSALNSFYDPLGLISPFILKGRLIFQAVCQLPIGWDDPVPNEYLVQWEKWIESLSEMKSLKIDRCFKPKEFSDVVEISLHHFSDASDYGYSGCHYLRFVNSDNSVHCCLIMGKSRVVPANSNYTTPRLELIAATLSSQIAKFIAKELDYEIAYELFWCDNTCALGYIRNSSKRFKKFVSNRVALISKTSDSSQWHYVDSDDNPADHGSRGLKVKGDDKKLSEWFSGPSFLWEHPLKYEDFSSNVVSENDPELASPKPTKVLLVKSDYVDIISHFENRVSCFLKMKKVMSFVLLFIEKCRKKNRKRFRKTRSQPEFKFDNLLTVEILSKATTWIFKLLQEKYFSSSTDSKLVSLNVFSDKDGLFRVGGRLKRSLLLDSIKYPVIIPKDSEVAKSIIRFYHEKVFHSGRNATMNEIRENGIWIISLCSLVKSVIWKCFLCRKLRGKFGTQIMADLPIERTLEAPPFSFCGVDLFGPFLVKERRALVKRWGVMYTCLSSRSVHLESVFSMDTNSFILCLRRFICRRGSIKMIKSDNGTNFIGCQSELKELFRSLDHGKIKSFLRDEFDADYIVWERNPPYSSHFGGVWERQIRSARNVLNGILLTHSQSFNDESFRTLLCEVECILNSRPLSVENISDPLSLKPITPMMLLTGKSKIVLPPPGAFGDSAAYSRRQWKRVQHAVNEFWTRWQKEFLSKLQERTKWTIKRRNFQVGDIVLLKTDEKRNQWPLGRIIVANTDEHGNCRKVTVKTLYGEFERPISNIVLMEECDSPPRSVQD